MAWPRAVFLALAWLWMLLGTASLAAAALFVLRPRRMFAAFSRPARWSPTGIAFFGTIVPAALALFKCAQLYSHELMEDSAVAANLAWNVAHGYGPISSVCGNRSIFAIHFSFTADLLAPFLWLWNSTAVLAIAHGLAMGSIPCAVLFIAWGLSGSIELSGALALLALSSPFLHDLVGAFMESGEYALPICIWGLAFWQLRRPWAAGAMALLLLTTREQAPLLLFGFAAYAIACARSQRHRKTAAMAAVAALAVWGLELWAMHQAEGATPIRHLWSEYYAPLGHSLPAIAKTALLRPWRVGLALVYPWSKLLPVLRAFVSVAFLPLAAGAALIPLALIWLPQQLAIPGSMFQTLAGLHSVFVVGPLLWCAAIGAERVWRRVPAVWRPRFLALLLTLAAYQFFACASFGLPRGTLPSAWDTAGPKAMAAVPPNASLWSDVFFAPELAMRRYIKVLPVGHTPLFDEGLFAPDRVLLSWNWVRRSDPEFTRQVLAFLRNRGYQPIFQEADLVVFANPKTLGREGGEAEWIQTLPKSETARQSQ